MSESPVNPFAVLLDAMTPQHFLGMALPVAFYGNSYRGAGVSIPKGLGELQQWMHKLGYWRQETPPAMAPKNIQDSVPGQAQTAAQEETA